MAPWSYMILGPHMILGSHMILGPYMVLGSSMIPSTAPKAPWTGGR